MAATQGPIRGQVTKGSSQQPTEEAVARGEAFWAPTQNKHQSDQTLTTKENYENTLPNINNSPAN